MAESMEKRKYSKPALIILILTGGIGYNALMTTGYIIQGYYSLFQQGTGFTDSQLGFLASIIGTLAIFGYFFGGVLADIFKTKFLMILSYIGGAACAIYMSTMPSYGIFVVLEILCSIFVIFTYWSPMAKFVRSLGPRSQEGKLYGFFYTGVGIGGAVAGFIVAGITARMDGVAGLKALLWIYAGMAVVAALAMIFLYKNPTNEETDEGDKFKLKYVLSILRMPEIWLLGIAGAAGYLINVANAYYAPLLEDTFGVSLAIVTAIATFRSFVIRLIIAPTSGAIIDKVKSSTKVMLYMMFAMLILMVIILVMPWNPSWAILAIAILILLAITYNMLTPTWFTPLSDIGIPDVMRGTAVGVTNAMIFCTDAFMYAVASNMIAKNGTAGLRALFIIILAAALVGIVCIIVIRKRIAAKKTNIKY